MVHPLRDHRGHRKFAAGVEHAEDVGVLQPGGDLDFPLEPFGAHGGGEIGPKHLDRDLAMVLEVLGEVDGGRAARAEFALEAVAVGQGRGQASRSVAHGRIFSRSSVAKFCT
jgi:hypothetical protein